MPKSASADKIPVDSEPLITQKCPDDLLSIVTETIGGVQFKFIAIMMIIFIFVSTDVFINRVLSNFPGAVEHKYATSYGTCLQGLFLAMAMILFDGLIQHKVI